VSYADDPCERCGRALQVGDFPFCPHGSVHRDYSKPFDAFDVDLGTSSVHLSDLPAVRKFERESEAAARDGSGRQLVVRSLSQNRGNRTDNVFGRPPDQSFPKRSRSGIPFLTGGGDVKEGD